MTEIQCKKCNIFNSMEDVYHRIFEHNKTIIGHKTENKLTELFCFVFGLVKSGFTGHVEVHFSQGGICKKTKHEDIE